MAVLKLRKYFSDSPIGSLGFVVVFVESLHSNDPTNTTRIPKEPKHHQTQHFIEKV